ncbi:MAG: hypothetical protein KJ872_12790 [Alphaproteobacteria bacterium]|nr:hypothetical protein [Alphaproteobacteria bacterium]
MTLKRFARANCKYPQNSLLPNLRSARRIICIAQTPTLGAIGARAQNRARLPDCGDRQAHVARAGMQDRMPLSSCGLSLPVPASAALPPLQPDDLPNVAPRTDRSA